MHMLRLLLAVCACLLAVPAAAAAQTPPAKTDVMLIFDTTGSMDESISEAQAQLSTVVQRLSASLPDVRFALGQVRDYEEPYGDVGDEPWELVQPLTADVSQLQVGIDSLYADGGGDNAESYGRALFEADLSTAAGWRPGARRVAVLVADNMPHDDDLNVGIAPEHHIVSSPYSTGVDLGRDGVRNTPDDIDWQPLLTTLNRHGLPLMFVLFHGDSAKLPYWKHWAGITGGDAVLAEDTDSVTLADTVVSVATRGASADLGPCDAGMGRGTDGACHAQPVIFVPGIMGSKLYCGDDEVWLDLKVNYEALMLKTDGVSPANPKNACNASMGPKDGAVLTKVLTKDVYEQDLAALNARFPGRVYVYAFDWRKNVTNALAGLDAIVERARAAHGGAKARVIAHSMGGLVTRAYVNDPARAAKLSHVVTVGTPYWGSPKSLLPLARGETEAGMPSLPDLDTFLSNENVRKMSVNFAGLYDLMPSDSWHSQVGDWFRLTDRKTTYKGADATADAIAKQWAGEKHAKPNAALYKAALNEHRTLIDGFKTNGVAYLAIAGSKTPTIAGIAVNTNTLFADDWNWSWANGDGTVAVFSAVQGAPENAPLGEAVARRYSCGVGHGDLTGDAEILRAAAEFVDAGGTNALSAQPCEAKGQEITVQAGTGGAAAAAAAGGALRVTIGLADGRSLTLEQAAEAGIVVLAEHTSGIATFVVPDGVAATITASGRRLTIKQRPLVNSLAGAESAYGPLTGKVTIAGGTVKRGNRTVKAARRDTVKPRTRVRVRRAGRGATLRFTARDRSGVAATMVEVGKAKPKRVTRSLRIRSIPRRGVLVRYQSQDIFGNLEKVRSLRVRR
jgi:pimeloyl-ACP methyl ester carboxylesterase